MSNDFQKTSLDASATAWGNWIMAGLMIAIAAGMPLIIFSGMQGDGSAPSGWLWVLPVIFLHRRRKPSIAYGTGAGAYREASQAGVHQMKRTTADLPLPPKLDA